MKTALRTFAAITTVVATTSLAGEDEHAGTTAAAPKDSPWEFALTAYPTVVRRVDKIAAVRYKCWLPRPRLQVTAGLVLLHFPHPSIRSIRP